MAKKERKLRSTDELVQVSKDINYELQMLRATAHTLTTGIGYGSKVQFVLLESFLIHARNLIAFLYSSGKKDDIWAVDYFTDPVTKWNKVRPKISKLLDDTRKEAGYRLAHVSYKRLNGVKRWEFMKILCNIRLILQKFLCQVQKSKLDPCLRILKKKAEASR